MGCGRVGGRAVIGGGAGGCLCFHSQARRHRLLPLLIGLTLLHLVLGLPLGMAQVHLEVQQVVTQAEACAAEHRGDGLPGVLGGVEYMGDGAQEQKKRKRSFDPVVHRGLRTSPGSAPIDTGPAPLRWYALCCWEGAL